MPHASDGLLHLRTAPTCRQRLIGRNMHCPLMPGCGSTEDRNLQAQVDGALPFQQAQGPQVENPRMRDFGDYYKLQLFENIFLVLLDAQPTDFSDVTIRQCICSHPISWTDCHRTLMFFLDVFIYSSRHKCFALHSCSCSWVCPSLVSQCSMVFHAEGLYAEWTTSVRRCQRLGSLVQCSCMFSARSLDHITTTS